eukprot:CAMPEP_0178521708 /NCGR_PEP_ID=MMETSP0696-20121128/28105_1 /TAXON_ID=265572 /ORGANISM="Extubocellulus spinifer, Strain CCMP396" /LENGTH=30 /DNA_ID= /DNA_START= /DNA_END= /DNA_ORIENTATION=
MMVLAPGGRGDASADLFDRWLPAWYDTREG